MKTLNGHRRIIPVALMIIVGMHMVRPFAVKSENVKDTPPVNIVAEMMSDSATLIVLPEGMMELLDYEEPPAPKVGTYKKATGFSVQVYADMKQVVAKNEANARRRQVVSRFPQYVSRVIYDQPYWRVYVGEFGTRDEAQSLVRQLQASFPAFARDIHVVRTASPSPKK